MEKSTDSASEPVAGSRSLQRYEQALPVFTPALKVVTPESKQTAPPFGLSDVLMLVRRHGLLLSCFLIVGLLLGCLATLLQTPIYRAHALLEVLSLNENFLNTKQTNPIENGENSYEASDLQTQLKILQEQTLARRVINKLDKHAPEKAPHNPWRPDWWPTGLFAATEKPVSSKNELENAAKTLTARTSGRTRIIDISIDSPSPKVAADFANTLSTEFVSYVTEQRWTATQNTSEWLSRQLYDTRVKLERSENALQEYARKSGLILTDEKSNLSEEKLRQLQQEMSAVTFNRITKQSRYELAQASSPDSLPDVLNDPGLSQTREKINDLRRQMAELNQMYTPEYRKVKAVEAQIESLQSAFDRGQRTILDRIKNEYLEARGKEKLLMVSYDAQIKQLGGENEKSIQYNILKREVDSNRQLYENMMLQLKSANLASALRPSNVRLLEAAETPTAPYSPSLALNCALGLFVGLLTGTIFVISRDGSDTTLKDPGDAQAWANLPELGFIPNANIDLRGDWWDRLTGSAQRLGRKLIGLPPLSSAHVRSMTEAGRNAILVADATRAILTSILLNTDAGEHPRVVVITSPSASEGKTTLTCNLAIAIAEIRQRVLIVDADLRRPQVHTLFNLPNDRGLSTLLLKEEALTQAEVKGIIQQTSIPGLHVLPSGPVRHKVSNLLYSQRLDALLKIFGQHYDMVLVDTPPMLQMGDARMLGRMADGVVLVTRARKTSYAAALAAHQRLTTDGIRVIGAVLNDWDPRVSNRRYYQRYLAPYYASSTGD